jgi:translocation and assembly module TamB
MPRRQTVFRVLRYSIVGLLALLLLTAAGLWIVIDTAPGLRLAGRLAKKLSTGQVEVGSVSGHLLGEFELHDVKYTGADGTVITVNRVHLIWSPSELLARRFHAQMLEVEGVAVASGPPKLPAPPPSDTILPSQLPVAIVVDALTLTAFELKSSSGGDPFQLTRADFAGSWIGTVLEVQKLETALPQTGDVLLTAKATMASDHIDFSSLQLHTAGDSPATVDGKGRLGFNQIASDLQLDWQNLRWPLVPPEDATVPTPPRVSAVTGGGHFTGTPTAYQFDLKTVASTVLPSADSPAKSTTKSNDKRAGKAIGKTADALASKIVAPPQKTNNAVIKAGANAQAPAGSVSAPAPGDASTDAKTLGRSSKAMIAATPSTPTPPQTINATLILRGSGGLERVKLDQLDLKAADAHVTAQGTVAWAPAMTADLDATIEKFNPALIAPDLAGEINGKISAKTTLIDGQPQVDFTAKLDHSKLHGYPLTLDAAGQVNGQTVRLAEALLTTGKTQLKVSGQVTPPFAISGRFDSADLAGLYLELVGHAAFDFKVDGTVERPHLVTKGEAGALKFAKNTLASLSWDADLDPDAPSKLSIIATEGEAGLKIKRVQLSGDGQLNYQHLKLEASTDRGDASLTVAGGFDREKSEWGGEISESKLSPSGFAAWSLEKPAGLLLGKTRMSLEPACFVGSGRACANLIRNVNGDGFRSEWNIDALQLEAFKPLLPKTMALSGRIDGRGELAVVNGDILSADGDLQVSGGRLEVKKGPTILLEAARVQAEQAPNGRLHAMVDLKLTQGESEAMPTSGAVRGRADVSAELALAPGAAFDQRALGGQVKIDIPDLAFIEPFTREVRQVGGSINGDVRIAGTPNAPKAEGSVVLADGHMRLASAGIELKDVQVKVGGRGDGPLTVDGSARSADGTLKVAGTVEPSTSPPTADLTLKADNFQAVAIPAARAWIGADLHLVSDASGVKLTGELTVPKAEITPQGLGGGGVSPSSDQVIVGAEAPVAEKPIAITTDVRIALGDSVTLEGYGLKTRLEGAVTVFEEPGRETRGQGELRLVDGAYKAYGQNLTIDYGRLIFTGGAITQPAVELRAVRKPRDDIEVGVRVRGTLDKPELTLDSTPSMTREQQLSWLVLGRPLDTASSSDRSAVSNAALSLGLTGGDYLAGKLGKTVGIDSISVGSTPGEDANAAQLTLGKYLTPRLFVSYGLGLFQPGNSFKMLYDIGHGFKLQTETGVVSGGDVLYTIERK